MQAKKLIAEMERIWEGGPDYDRWHDARLVAVREGATKVYPSRHNGEYGLIWQMPDGSRVWIANSGGAIRVAKRRVAGGITA